MTTVYFIRHAESDHRVHDDFVRPLSSKGLKDCSLVTAFLLDKQIDVVLSSPYKRAFDTVSGFAACAKLPIRTVEGLRERSVGRVWIDDFSAFSERQWSDFSYKLSDGESLAEVQGRNIAALNEILARHKDKNIVIGTHGTALSAMIHFFDRTYGFADFSAMVNLMPWVVRMDFTDDGCIGMEKINLFDLGQKPDYDQCVVRMAELGALKAYRFAVVFARYKDQWLYCRAKERDTFETAGGHIEPGESPLDGAKRELFEETGAVRYVITPLFDYSVHVQTGFSNGQVFIADIEEIGDLPLYEMAEIRQFDTIPDKMRFPKILPVLFEKVRTMA